MNLPTNLEHKIVDFVSAVSPWLAPVVPAYLVFSNSIDRLDIPPFFAFILALAVECIGLASVHTAVTFWTWNDEKRKSDDPAPHQWAIVAGVFYVAIVLVVNALLDIWTDPLAKTIAKALLSLLSVDAALIIALRAQHKRRLSEIETEKVEKKTEKTSLKPSRKPETNETPIEKKSQWVKDYMARAGVSRATAYRTYAAEFQNGHEK